MAQKVKFGDLDLEVPSFDFTKLEGILPLIVKNPRTLYNIEIYGPRILIGLIILNLIGIPILSTIILTPVSIIFYLLTGA